MTLRNIVKVKKFIEKLEKHHVSEYASQCSYYIVISFVPFLILLSTAMQALGFSREALFYIITTIIPNGMSSDVITIAAESYSKPIGTISISLIFLLWSSAKGFHALSKGFHTIYEVPKKYNFFYFRLRSIIGIIIFIVVIITALLLMGYGWKIDAMMAQNNLPANRIFSAIIRIRTIIVFVDLFIIFILIYKFIPKHKVKAKEQIPGAIFSTIAWVIISYTFSLFLKIFTGISNIYGSLTTIMLIMMWIFFCIYALLVGAEINREIERRRKAKKKNESKNEAK